VEESKKNGVTSPGRQKKGSVERLLLKAEKIGYVGSTYRRKRKVAVGGVGTLRSGEGK